MKKISLLFYLITFVSLSLNAQFGGGCSNKLVKNVFAKSKTFVLLTGDEQFDNNLKSGFEKYWKTTKYEFVEDMESISETDEDISYVMPYTVKISDGYSTQEYTELGVFIGGKGDLYERLVANIILDGFGREDKLIEAAYRAEGMVKLMQDFIDLKLSDASISTTSITRVRYTAGEIYNKKSKLVGKKTLLVDEAQLTQGEYAPTKNKEKIDKAFFSKYYKGKVKFVSKSELEEAINSNNKDYCYLIPVYSRKKYFFVIDCQTGSLYYNGYEISGLFFTKKDLKKLNKATQN
jgi:hypothetical protein